MSQHTNAIVLRSEVKHFTMVDIIFGVLKEYRCQHQERPGTPFCFGDPVYQSLNETWICEEHAADYMEEDAEYIARMWREIEEGQKRLQALGRKAPTLCIDAKITQEIRPAARRCPPSHDSRNATHKGERSL